MPEPDYADYPDYPADINAHLWRSHRGRSHRAIGGRLRCGVLVEGRGGVEQWAHRVLELLEREPLIALESIYLLPPGESSEPQPVLVGWLNRWSSSAAAPLRREELKGPRNASTVRLGTVDFRGTMSAAALDVLIWLESRPFSLDCEGLARFGVWSFCCGDPDQPRTVPAYWKEVVEGYAYSTIALESDAGRAGIRRLDVAQVETRTGLRVTRNALQPLSLAGPLLIRNLLNVVERGGLSSNSAARVPERRAQAMLGNFDVARLAVRQAYHNAWLRFRPRGQEGKWFVAVRNNREAFRTSRREFVPSGFRDVIGHGGSQFADPFVVEDNGRQWLFVEEIPAGSAKGRLAVMELDRDGACGAPVTMLERPFHLSYPFVFRVGREFFMIPETSANNNIELYRASRFPFEWGLEKVFCSNVRAVDTTPFFQDGIWYFFTTSARIGQETFLFWSTQIDGEWHYHPRNPICSDVRRARGAGALFHCEGDLIRPAQDCSVRYGYAIALNRVLTISPTEYEEELIEVIYPTWRKGLLGTHTLSANESFEAIDGLRYRQ